MQAYRQINIDLKNRDIALQIQKALEVFTHFKLEIKSGDHWISISYDAHLAREAFKSFVNWEAVTDMRATNLALLNHFKRLQPQIHTFFQTLFPDATATIPPSSICRLSFENDALQASDDLTGFFLVHMQKIWKERRISSLLESNCFLRINYTNSKF